MLYELGERVERHVLVTRDSVESDVPDGTELRSPDAELRGLDYWWWAARTAAEIMQHEPSGESWWVHEHVVGLASLMLQGLDRLLDLPEFETIVSVYAAEVTFLKEQRWRIDPYGSDMTLRQDWVYASTFLKKLVQHALSWAAPEHMIGNSRIVEEDIRQIFPNRNCHVVPTAVDLEFFNRDDDSSKETSWTKNRLKFLYVGQLAGFKGFGVLIHAFHQLLETGRDAELALFGGCFDCDEAWLDEIVERYDVSDRIVRPGRVPRRHLVDYYRTADVLICPSFHEGSPRVVKEALAAGCPAIVSDIPGTRIIDPDGDVLQFFEPGDAEHLTALMIELVDNPERRARLERRGQQLIRNFSPKAIADRYRRLYDELSTPSSR